MYVVYVRIYVQCMSVYIGWSDVIYLWSQCDRHFVGQHVVLCVVKWWRYVALFESIESVGLRKINVRIIAILLRKWRLLTSEQQTFRRACPIKWRKTADMKKLRHWHPMYMWTVFHICIHVCLLIWWLWIICVHICHVCGYGRDVGKSYAHHITKTKLT